METRGGLFWSWAVAFALSLLCGTIVLYGLWRDSRPSGTGPPGDMGGLITYAMLFPGAVFLGLALLLSAALAYRGRRGPAIITSLTLLATFSKLFIGTPR